ncbi:MAG TPA: DUF11 domain-containing protein, partial [Roseiflexaceae bacterium]|nr:DUF11 domain-containing protein [Roseiflexaceae bacterium]
ASAQAVSLVDSLPAEVTFVSSNPAPSTVNGQTLTWMLGTQAPGASGTISLVTQSAATLANNTQARNSATIATTTPGDNPADNSAAATTLLQRADVWVSKSSPTTFPVASGAPVEYLVDAGNNGPTAANNVQLVDQTPVQLSGVTWNCVQGCTASGTGTMTLDFLTLDAGATMRVRVTGTAQTALAREDFVNTATIRTATPQTRTDNDQSSVPGAVWTTDVQVVKLSAPQVIAGSTFTATLLVRNNGPAVAQSVVLADTLPDGVGLVSATTGPEAVQGTRLEWQLGDLASGASVEIGLVLDAAADLVNGSQLVNTASVTTTAPDRDTGNDSAAATTLVVTQADLEITKSGPDVAYAGETFEYELTYRNNGPSWARDIVVTDALPPELAFAGEVPPASQQNDALLMWSIGDLAPGQSGMLRVSAASAPEQAEASRTVENQASISSGSQDLEPAN